MSTENALDLIEAEFNGHPLETNGWGLYRHLLDLARRIEANDHEGLVGALDIWLKQRPPTPRFDMAMGIAAELKLTELRDGLQQFRQELLAGKHGLPIDTRWIDKAIRAIS